MLKEEKRKRMVVEEVTSTVPEIVTEVLPPTVVSDSSVEIKEKVEELQDLTQDISESVEKSEKIQEEIAEAVDTSSEVTEPINIDPSSESEMKPEEHFTIQEPPKESEFLPIPELKSSSSTSPLVIIIPGIFLLGALLGGIYFYQASVTTQKDTVPSPSPTTTVTVINQPTPAASSSATIDLTKYPINIMNGSGIVGEAGKVKTLVETAGFKVAKTGNASSYDFTKTVIKAKADVPAEFLAQLSTTLSKTYTLDTNQVLAIGFPDSVQVVVGSTKAN